MTQAQAIDQEFLPGDRIREDQAAELCGVKVATLRDWRCRRVRDQPPYFKAGSRVWYSKRRCRAWVKSRVRPV